MTVYVLTGIAPYDHCDRVIGVFQDKDDAEAAKLEFHQYKFYNLYVEPFIVE